MEKIIKAGLVLEGGGMRGLYTEGILDFFMEKGLKFDHVYGVSAGAIHLTSYMSGQMGREYRISTNYLKDKKYMSYANVFKGGELFDAEFCYHTIPDELDPFDYEAFTRYPGVGYAVATDLETGRPAYFKIRDVRKDIKAIQASASLPLVSNNVIINGKPYLDGGMADSIPIRRSIHDGNKKHVVILTRPYGYEKKPTSNLGLIAMKYKKYPGLVKAMKYRHIRYNNTLNFIYEQENKDNVFVFRPDPLVKIERIEKDVKKLRVLYLQGYHDAAINYELMMEYLNK